MKPGRINADNRSDYPNLSRQSFGQPCEGYPGFILWRDLLSREAEMKLSLQLAPWLKTALPPRGTAKSASSHRPTGMPCDLEPPAFGLTCECEEFMLIRGMNGCFSSRIGQGPFPSAVGRCRDARAWRDRA
jgi:hypothetical protein